MTLLMSLLALLAVQQIWLMIEPTVSQDFIGHIIDPSSFARLQGHTCQASPM